MRALTRRHRLPYAFSAAVARQLADARILEAKEGAHGGHRLARAPHRISVAEIARAAEGGIALTGCLDPRSHQRCPQLHTCTARAGVVALQQKLSETLRRMTVADFLKARAHARTEPFNPA